MHSFVNALGPSCWRPAWSVREECRSWEVCRACTRPTFRRTLASRALPRRRRCHCRRASSRESAHRPPPAGCCRPHPGSRRLFPRTSAHVTKTRLNELTQKQCSVEVHVLQVLQYSVDLRSSRSRRRFARSDPEPSSASSVVASCVTSHSAKTKQLLTLWCIQSIEQPVQLTFFVSSSGVANSGGYKTFFLRISCSSFRIRSAISASSCFCFRWCTLRRR